MNLDVTTTSNGKTLLLLDASAFKESSCLLKLFYNVVYGFRSPTNSIEIEWGSAFHLFKSTLRQKSNPDTSDFAVAAAKAREYFTKTPYYSGGKMTAYMENPEYLWNACYTYFIKYQKDDFEIVNDDEGNALVELKFAIPYYIDDDVEVIMMGTKDELGKFKNGIYAIADLKTSSAYDVEKYLDSYKLSPQLLMYYWACHEYAKLYPDSIYAKVVEHGLGVFIDGVFRHGKDKPIELVRSSIRMFNSRDLQDFSILLRYKTLRLINAVKEWRRDKSVLPLREGMLNDSCAGKYPCKYLTACATQDQETAFMLLEKQFTQVKYDPATFGGPA
jgi:hypothetical protein